MPPVSSRIKAMASVMSGDIDGLDQMARDAFYTDTRDRLDAIRASLMQHRQDLLQLYERERRVEDEIDLDVNRQLHPDPGDGAGWAV